MNNKINDKINQLDETKGSLEMIDAAKIINDYCLENKISIGVSFNMPSGYETANGMYDDETKTIYINLNKSISEYEQAFYLYHELRHALQYNQSNRFSDDLILSLGYVIMFDGTCYKIMNGSYLECKIDGEEEYLLNLYKGQLYEIDANAYAYEMVKKAYGDTPELKKLYNLFQPTRIIPFDEYKKIYRLIDRKIRGKNMREEIIMKVQQFVKTELLKLKDYEGRNIRMAQYRIEHSFRVANICKEIALKENLNVEMAYVAGLLHDIGYSVDYKSKEDFMNHGRVGAKIARPFLLELGYSKDEVEEMCYGIAIHVDDKADFEHERTILAGIIGDADNIDRFDAYRLFEGLQNVDYMNLPIDDQRAHVEKTLSKLYKLRDLKLETKTSQGMWEEKIDFMIEFYNKLHNQIENSK